MFPKLQNKQNQCPAGQTSQGNFYETYKAAEKATKHLNQTLSGKTRAVQSPLQMTVFLSFQGTGYTTV